MATRRLGLKLSVFEAGNPSEIDAAFSEAVQQQVDALLVSADPFFTVQRKQIVAQAERHALPAVYPFELTSKPAALRAMERR